MTAVGAEDRVGIVSACHGDNAGEFVLRVVYVDFSICGEGISLAVEFLAGIGDEFSVGTPGQLLGPSVRLEGQLVSGGVFPEDVRGSFRSDLFIEAGNEGLGEFGYPMVPMPVHEVLGDIGLRQVHGHVHILGTCDFRIGDCADIKQLVPCRSDCETADSGADVTDAGFSVHVQDPVSKGSLPYLASLDEKDFLPVFGPSGVGNAFPFLGQLDLVASVRVGDEEVAACTVAGQGGVADAVEDLRAVGGELGVGQPSEVEHDSRGHLPVGHLDIPGPCITFLGPFGFFGGVAAAERNHERDRESGK